MRSKRIVTLCATCSFYCDRSLNASFRQLSLRLRPHPSPMKEVVNCYEYHCRIDSIDQAFYEAKNKAAQRNPRKSRKEQLQCLVANWKSRHQHSTKHTQREAHSHPGGSWL